MGKISKLDPQAESDAVSGIPYTKVSFSLNNPQNSEMKFCENMNLSC
jgi:hypothetical protein